MEGESGIFSTLQQSKFAKDSIGEIFDTQKRLHEGDAE
jgi:hypothetical protein